MVQNNSTGDRLRIFALSKCPSIKDFADLIRMDAGNVQKYLNNKRKPGTPLLKRLQKEGCDINWLLTGEGEMCSVNEEKTADKRSLNSSSTANKLYAKEHIEKGQNFLIPAVGRRMATLKLGINEGDLMIIDPLKTPDVGDIVLKSTPDGMEMAKYEPGDKQPMGCLIQLIRNYPPHGRKNLE